MMTDRWTTACAISTTVSTVGYAELLTHNYLIIQHSLYIYACMYLYTHKYV